MGKQKIRFDRETAEKNEAFERIRELDGKVNSAATLVSYSSSLRIKLMVAQHDCRSVSLALPLLHLRGTSECV
jgi:hypothetical protein